MSQMSTTAVLKCRIPDCNNFIAVSDLMTTQPDEDAVLLEMFMANLKKIALCPYHMERYNYYASQGRVEDFEAGRP